MSSGSGCIHFSSVAERRCSARAQTRPSSSSRPRHSRRASASSPTSQALPDAQVEGFPDCLDNADPDRKERETMPGKESEAVKGLYVKWTAARLNVEQRDEEAWGNLTAEPRGVDYIEINAGGVSAMWLAPKGCAEDRVLLCMHSGGFVGGSIYSHRKLFGHMAKAAGARALVFDYRLTPEYRHRAQVDDATAAYRW